MRRLLISTMGVVAAGLCGVAHADTFVNGGFEDGNDNGWTRGGGYRGGVFNPLNASDFNPGGSLYDPAVAASHSQVIDTSYVDPNVGSVIGTTVYSGKYSFRVEDTTWGGYASVISQRVNNYTDPDIFFAWKAVMLGAHGTIDAATMVITLTDLTTGSELIRREYNAADDGSGVDSRFASFGGNFYTPDWQIEHLTTGASAGHDLLLSVLGSDCQPTGHWGYVYLDGFGAVPPPPGVPEPASWAMMIAGFGMVGGTMRRRARSVSFA